MSRQDRLSQILEIVVEKGSVDVEYVAAALEVSTATIRRDFDTLAKKQLLSRTHGGAVVLQLHAPLSLDQSLPQEIPLNSNLR